MRANDLPGAMVSNAWEEDPKRLAFTFARYKFVAKMLAGKDTVLEVGAESGFMSKIVRASVGHLIAVDKAPTGPDVLQADLTTGRVLAGPFDAAYALDVLEHIWPEQEDAFLGNIAAALKPTGTLIIGMPSLESQAYASTNSLREHVNCKTEEGLREVMQRHFHCVYLFGMNDETLHTGFGAMCHYRLAVANMPREVV